jgi:hypothetical protein
MADMSKSTDGPSPDSAEGYDASLLPDFDHEFLSEKDVAAFANALSAPDPSPSSEDLTLLSPTPQTPTTASRGSFDISRRESPSLSRRDSIVTGGIGGEGAKSRESLFITAQNDWAPVNPRRRGKKEKRGAKGGRTKGKEKGKVREGRRSRDETREGYLYTLLKWPFLGVVGAWVVGLGISYLFTRLYIWLYEHFVAWRGKRERIRQKLHATTNYSDWVKEAKELDTFLGNDKWKDVDEYAYYDSKTVRRVLDQIRKCRRRIEQEESGGKVGMGNGNADPSKAVEDLKALIEACVKNNFVGVENSRLYSQTYYGTKNLVQEFIDEGEFTRSFS